MSDVARTSDPCATCGDDTCSGYHAELRPSKDDLRSNEKLDELIQALGFDPGVFWARAAILRWLGPPSETNEPSMGLLVSMAIRMDHGLGVPGYYDQPMFGNSGPTHQQRLDAAITTARQMWEEATGHGFYRPEKEAEYAARASLKANEPS